MHSQDVLVSTLIRRLAADAVSVQELLDRDNERRARRFAEDLEHGGLSPDDPLVRAVRPSLLRLQEHAVSVEFELTRRREVRFGVDLMLAGRVVTTFAEASYGTEETRRNRMRVLVAAVPVTEENETSEELE